MGHSSRDMGHNKGMELVWEAALSTKLIKLVIHLILLALLNADDALLHACVGIRRQGSRKEVYVEYVL